MDAAELLQALRLAGFTLRASGVSIIVKPGARLTDSDAERIGAVKQELLALLRAEAGDERVTCATCRHHDPSGHRCRNFRAALLACPEVAPALAVLPQNCPGFGVRPPASAGQDEPGRPETAPGRPPGDRQATQGHPEPASGSLAGQLTERQEPKDPRHHSLLTGQGLPSAEIPPDAPPCNPLHRTGGAHA